MENKLLKKVQKAIEENEYNMVRISGVNCSRADLETLELLLEYKINNGSFGNFMILGEVKQVLENNNIL